MKLKNIYKFMLGLALLPLWSGCDDPLDLEPAQSISEGLALSSDPNVKAVLIGAYDALSNPDLYGGNLLRNAELLGGDGEVFWAGTFNAPGEIFAKTMISANLDAQEQWLESYETINICNNVLSDEAAEALNDADEDVVQGEALFIRGLVYFDLVRYYAAPYVAGQANSQLGVPLVLEPTRGVSENDQVARASVAEVYAQVLADLEMAAGMLPENNDFFATSGAATALMARVYLQMGMYAEARDAASAVIGSGVYSLTTEFDAAFNNGTNSSEDIFAIQVTVQDGANNMNLFFSIPAFGGRDGDIDILEGHLNLYDSADVRLSLFYEGNGAFRSGKWTNQFGNVGIIRLAEMYLIRAECNQRLGTDVGAAPVDDYNLLHTRAGLPAATEVTLDDILLERRLELAHEGFRIHDLKRLQQPSGSFAYDDPRLVFPIPLREVNANPNLEQNTGY